MITITTDIKCKAKREIGVPVMICDVFGNYEILPYDESIIGESKVFVEFGVISKVNKKSVNIAVHMFN